MQGDVFANINIESLIPNKIHQRNSYNEDSIKELALSIKEVGIIEPIIVRKVNEKYEIIVGERRVKAAKLLGLKEIPAIIKELSDEQAYKIILVENIQRDNVSPVEEATTFKKIMDAEKIKEDELSKKIGKSELSIVNKLKLLTLSQNVQKAITNKKISEKHARILLKLDNKEEQDKYLNKIIEEKLTIKELNNLIKKKEEKESDNMNNDSFFPNQTLNQTPTNDASLNAINQQAMAPTTAIPTPVQPTITEQGFDPNIIQFPTNNSTAPNPILTPPITPTIEPAPLMGVNNEMPQEPTNTENNTGFLTEPTAIPTPQDIPAVTPESTTTEPTPSVMSDALNDIPLFASQPATENNPAPADENTVSNEALPVQETPANNEQSTIEPPAEENNVSPIPVFETAVAPEPVSNETAMPSLENNNTPVTVPIDTEDDKLSKLIEFLNNENINYKQYSNETNKCIIIEI